MGSENRAPTTDELEKMKELVARSMDDGACGLSTGLIYAPCVYADTTELIALCQRVAAYGGVFVIHMRNESDHILEALQETIEIGQAAGVAIHISHIKVAGRRNWEKMTLLPTLGLPTSISLRSFFALRWWSPGTAGSVMAMSRPVQSLFSGPCRNRWQAGSGLPGRLPARA